MLQKLESAYLAILRFMVIVIATILLVAVAVYGGSSWKLLAGEPKETEFTPKASDQQVIESVIGKEQNKLETTGKPDSADQASSEKDPNQPFYDRAVAAIAQFIQKYQKPAEPKRRYELDENGIAREVIDPPEAPPSVNKQAMDEHLKYVCKSFEKGQHIEACAKNLADVSEKTFADKSVIARAATTSAISVADEVLNNFKTSFQNSIDEHNEKLENAQAEYLMEKAKAMTNLYVAGGSFLGFLIIVFLSILIKIERNLRPRESRC